MTRQEYEAYIRDYLWDHLDVDPEDEDSSAFAGDIFDITGGSTLPTEPKFVQTFGYLRTAHGTAFKGKIPANVAAGFKQSVEFHAKQGGTAGSGDMGSLLNRDVVLTPGEAGFYSDEGVRKNDAGLHIASEYDDWAQDHDIYELSSVYRKISRYDEQGVGHPVDETNQIPRQRRRLVPKGVDQSLKDYFVWVPRPVKKANPNDPDTEVAQFLAARQALISGSLEKDENGNFIQKYDYPRSGLGEIFAGFPQFYIRKYSSGKVVGRLKQHGKFTSIPIDPELLEKFANRAKAMLIENYDRKPIGQGGGEQSGTLRKAVASAQVNWVARDKAFTAIVAINEEIRRPRRFYGGTQSRQPQDLTPRVGYYGRMVFFGRRAVKGKPYLRFKMRGEYLTATNVLPSRKDLNIFDFSPAQMSELMDILIKSIPVTLKSDIKERVGAE